MLQNASSFAGLNLFAPESAIKNIANFFAIPFAKSAVANNMSCKRPAAALTLPTIFANQKYRIAYSSEKQKVIAISSEEKSAIALSTRRSDKQSYDLAETETETSPMKKRQNRESDDKPSETLCFGASLKRDPTPTATNTSKDKQNTISKSKASAVIIWLHGHGQENSSGESRACLDLKRGVVKAKKKVKKTDNVEDENEDDDDDDEDDDGMRETRPRRRSRSIIASAMPENTDFGKKMGHVRWVLPSADKIHVDLKMDNVKNPCRFWFNIKRLSIAMGNQGEDKEDDHEPKHLSDSTKKIHDLIDLYVQLGIPENRIVIGGFGQGGAMAAVAALRYGKSLAGVVIQNGWLPLCAEKDLKKSKTNMPIFFSEGDMDITMLHEVKERTKKMLLVHNYPTSHVKAWFLNHCDALLIRRKVLEFLCEVLPESGRPSHKSSSFKFEEPQDMHRWAKDFSLDRYSQTRGLV